MKLLGPSKLPREPQEFISPNMVAFIEGVIDDVPGGRALRDDFQSVLNMVGPCFKLAISIKFFAQFLADARAPTSSQSFTAASSQGVVMAGCIPKPFTNSLLDCKLFYSPS